MRIKTLIKLLNSGVQDDKELVKAYLQTLKKIELKILRSDCLSNSLVNYPQAQEILENILWELLH